MKRILPVVLIGLLVAAALTHNKNNPDQPGPGPDHGPNSSRQVLLYYETAPTKPYSHDQDVAILSAQNGDVRAWIDANCKQDGFRTFDPDQDVSGQSKFWQDAFADAKKSNAPQPWVKIHNGWRWNKEHTFSNVDELKKLLGAQ